MSRPQYFGWDVLPSVRHSMAAGLMVFALAPVEALAGPVLQFEYLNSGQVVSPTELVLVEGRITNVGDADMVSGFSSGSFLIPQPAYDQYSWKVGAFPRISPSSILSLAVGDSVDWAITTLQTWPISGSRGDPVPAGQYFLAPDSLQITYKFLFEPPDPLTGLSRQIDVLPASSNFTWTVGSPAAVPEPASLALLCAALAGLGLTRRRKTS